MKIINYKFILQIINRFTFTRKTIEMRYIYICVLLTSYLLTNIVNYAFRFIVLSLRLCKYHTRFFI